MPQDTAHPLIEARRAWEAILGPAHVIADDEVRRAASTATHATQQPVPLILRPGSTEEVQACVQVAARYRVPLYTVSTGHNWGYGSSVPATPGNVLVDLGRMNRIVAYDDDLGYVTVEPGVTQRQLFDYLSARGSRYWMDATGASPDCSLIGNTLERGFGHTPYGDHAANACAFEVVLGDGTRIETGLGRFDGCAATPVYRWGLGPVLDGLFTQSNFGIVTRMTIWLMPAPERFEAFFFRCDEGHSLGGVVDAMRPLRMNGTLRSASHIGNDYKVLNGLSQYPWDRTGGATPLQPSLMAQMRRELRIGVWNGSGGLYGTKAQVAEARRLLRQALRGKVAQLQFINDRTLRLAERFAAPYGRVTGWNLSEALELLRPVYGLMRGQPTSATMASAYWRKRTPPPADPDPDRDRCGLLWCAPVAPLEGRHAEHMAGICIGTLLAHGFEPMLSLTTVTDRALTCVVSIAYDRDVPGEDGRASACYDELVATLAAHGYRSYRRGVHPHGRDAPTPYDEVVRRLKKALDPSGVLAPGRYGIA
jgi:4-cresol dehydrogenase (hydroxylating)